MARLMLLVLTALASCFATAPLASGTIETGLSPPITGPVCSVLDHGAVADNATLATKAIQATIDLCAAAHPGGSTVLVPRGSYRTASISLRSNMRFHLAEGAGLYGSTDPADYTISYQWFGGRRSFNFDALIRGANLTNVSVTGSNAYVGPSPTGAAGASIVDGVGWKWWCQAGCIPLMRDGLSRMWCDALNPDNTSLPTAQLPEPRGQGRPRLVNFYNCTGVVLQGFTAQNSPHWTIHLQYSKNLVVQNMTVLSPRSVGNTDGIDPDSCINTLVTDSYIEVGDDGVSVKSDNITNDAGESVMMPTRNLTMRRLQIRSRNWCIGSSTFGGIYDVLLEDSVIGAPGDPRSPVPWAIKFKSHEFFPGSIVNVTVRRVAIGTVGPTPWMYPAGHSGNSGAFALGLTYSGKPLVHRGTPYVRNVTFEDIHVESAGTPGAVTGLPESCFDQLTFRNVTFGRITGSNNWTCHNVQQSSFVQEGVSPPFDRCTNDNSAGTCSSRGAEGAGGLPSESASGPGAGCNGLAVAADTRPVMRKDVNGTTVHNANGLAGCCAACDTAGTAGCEAFFTGPLLKECVLYPAGSVIGRRPSPNHTAGFRGGLPPMPPPPPPPPPAGESLDQKLVVLSQQEADAYGAKCLDGSPPAVYYSPARGAENQDNWVLYFKGGGWCFNEEQCAERSTTVLGTTKILPEFLNETWSKTSGPLHPNTTLNPTFANYHRVLLWYCDGASFAGSVSHPVTNTSTKTGKTTTMWFRGRAVLVSLLAKLKQDYGLDKAKQVLLTGCSAGGMSTYLHADFVKAQIASPQLFKYKVAALSGFFLDHKTAAGQPLIRPEYDYIFEMQNMSSGVNQACVKDTTAAGAANCSTPQQNYKYIESHIFVLNSMLDAWQMGSIFQPGCSSPTKCNATQITELDSYQHDFFTAISGFGTYRKAGNGAFLYNCILHCGEQDTDGFNQIALPGSTPATATATATGGVDRQSRTVMQEALSTWWESDGGDSAAAHTYVEGCSLDGPEACNPTCPGVTLTDWGAGALSEQ